MPLIGPNRGDVDALVAGYDALVELLERRGEILRLSAASELAASTSTVNRGAAPAPAAVEEGTRGSPASRRTEKASSIRSSKTLRPGAEATARVEVGVGEALPCSFGSAQRARRREGRRVVR